MDLSNSTLSFAEAIQKAITIKEAPKETIQLFIDDFKLICGEWYWEGLIDHKEMHDDEFIMFLYRVEYSPIPSNHWKTCADLMRAAFKCYQEGQFDAGKIIILTIDQWINTAG
jgi:hypothetical protein